MFPGVTQRLRFGLRSLGLRLGVRRHSLPPSGESADSRPVQFARPASRIRATELGSFQFGRVAGVTLIMFGLFAAGCGDQATDPAPAVRGAPIVASAPVTNIEARELLRASQRDHPVAGLTTLAANPSLRVERVSQDETEALIAKAQRTGQLLWATGKAEELSGWAVSDGRGLVGHVVGVLDPTRPQQVDFKFFVWDRLPAIDAGWPLLDDAPLKELRASLRRSMTPGDLVAAQLAHAPWLVSSWEQDLRLAEGQRLTDAKVYALYDGVKQYGWFLTGEVTEPGRASLERSTFYWAR